MTEKYKDNKITCQLCGSTEAKTYDFDVKYTGENIKTKEIKDYEIIIPLNLCEKCLFSNIKSITLK